MGIKSYSEAVKLPTFKERYNYLKLDGSVGYETFGHARRLNQMLYQSKDWKRVRDKVIVRDKACDLAFEGYEIPKYVMIHHINPITADDILERRACVFDLENLICVSKRTHNAIHFGDESQLFSDPVERKPNDTCPWKV